MEIAHLSLLSICYTKLVATSVLPSYNSLVLDDFLTSLGSDCKIVFLWLTILKMNEGSSKVQFISE